MRHLAVLGAQWGDEGKGKIIDLVAPNYDVVVRAQGGNNAGHTVVVDGKRHAFHLLPSAMLYPELTCVLGNGLVINPDVLKDEICRLKEHCGDNHAKLLISDRAHVITKRHVSADLKKDQERLGTTGRGIGPAYADKAYRKGARVAECYKYNKKVWKYLKEYVTDTSSYLYRAIKNNKKILFEGAQAALLDIDHGTYPYVTSSNCTVGGLFTGSGIFTRDLDVIGVVKAYTTRVGMNTGPMPTYHEDDKDGIRMRDQGNEYGTTTGRARRCGWLDLVIVRQAIRLNSMTSIALTKLDVLSGFKQVKICISYGEKYEDGFPTNADVEIEPQYITLSGWGDIRHCRQYEELPLEARKYVETVEELTGVPIDYIGCGPERDQIVIRK